MNKDYIVSWKVAIVNCGSPRLAAEQARAIQLDPDNESTYYRVTDLGHAVSYEIDLAEPVLDRKMDEVEGEDLPFMEEVIVKGADRCPRCGCWEIQGRFVETGSGEATQRMDCIECGLSWLDGYRQTSVTVVEWGEER